MIVASYDVAFKKSDVKLFFHLIPFLATNLWERIIIQKFLSMKTANDMLYCTTQLKYMVPY